MHMQIILVLISEIISIPVSVSFSCGNFYIYIVSVLKIFAVLFQYEFFWNQ